MRWIKDEDGDIGLTFWNIVTFLKYKNSTIVYWFKDFPTADKYQSSVYTQE